MPDVHDVLSWLRDDEVANDGGTIFMATRSTGQIEAGPPGFSIATVDARGVSWRSESLYRAWPEKGIFDTRLGPNRNGRKW